MPCVEAIITGHFEIFFRYVLDQKIYKVQDRKGLFNKGVILMSVVMESDKFTVIGIDPGRSNDRTTQITADILYDSIRVTEVGFSINVKTVFIFFIDSGFCLFKRRADMFFQFIQQSSLESFGGMLITSTILCAGKNSGSD